MTARLRQLAVSKQGLAANTTFGQGLAGTLRAIEHLGYVQIDTIAVVERAHHHVLWNRVADYQPDYLNQLLRQQHIFEYWFHAASYLPMRDYRYALPQMTAVRSGEIRYYANGDPAMMKEILARVAGEGELRMRDISQKTAPAQRQNSQKNSEGGWWNWGAGRRAVEQLYMQGELMVCERNGMEKVYNLAERCVPADLDVSMPTLDEYAQYLFDTTLRAHGVFSWKQLLHLKVGPAIRNAMRQILEQQLDAGRIEACSMVNGQTLYVDRLAQQQTSALQPSLSILSPFDNLVIHRERLSHLFDFDYKIECYVAADKRVYGYFALPILYGDRLLGRIDCKAHRAEKRLELISLHLENGIQFELDTQAQGLDRAHFIASFNQALERFALFNQCHSVDRSRIALLG
ncbi:hypothetical protein EC844_1365 [Acinetobacter calcoaceticus]|uniref:Winged helix-turn-helix domain-containing protein n=1 Tax=Acinetobacter calcoaceticus TaxID=471 RepID=A0A4R1XF36_ACICA|nr:hypothetical protein EC844_1365 [Acinetobacter calcoaceticus]